MSSVKRKLKHVSLKQKCKVIKFIEKGMTNKAASEKFGIPRKIISTWMKKTSFLQSLEQQTLRMRLQTSGSDNFKMVFSEKELNMSIDGTMIKEKALFFAEKFKFSNFKASDVWTNKLKKN